MFLGKNVITFVYFSLAHYLYGTKIICGMKYLIDSKINFFLWRYLPLPYTHRGCFYLLIQIIVVRGKSPWMETEGLFFRKKY